MKWETKIKIMKLVATNYVLACNIHGVVGYTTSLKWVSTWLGGSLFVSQYNF